jgi:hypothetical protein
MPWMLVRGVAIHLYNEHASLEGANAILDGLLSFATVTAPKEVVEVLRGDQRTLNRNRKWDELKSASNDLPKAISITSDLLKGAEAEERKLLLEVKTTLEARRTTQVHGRIFWGLVTTAVVGFLIYGALDKPGNFSRSSSTSDSTPPRSMPNSVTTTSTPRNAREQRPPPGANRILETSEVRYCVFQAERLDILRTQISTDDEITRFNRLVIDFNSRCGSYRYRPGVLDQIKGELVAKRSSLIYEAQFLLYF